MLVDVRWFVHLLRRRSGVTPWQRQALLDAAHDPRGVAAPTWPRP
ncbi:hypothetical protein [Mycolicibacterium palauense]|nr:hypothetical protein [Mycolicibacterium palauense]